MSNCYLAGSLGTGTHTQRQWRSTEPILSWVCQCTYVHSTHFVGADIHTWVIINTTISPILNSAKLWEHKRQILPSLLSCMRLSYYYIHYSQSKSYFIISYQCHNHFYATTLYFCGKGSDKKNDLHLSHLTIYVFMFNISDICSPLKRIQKAIRKPALEPWIFLNAFLLTFLDKRPFHITANHSWYPGPFNTFHFTQSTNNTLQPRLLCF